MNDGNVLGQFYADKKFKAKFKSIALSAEARYQERLEQVCAVNAECSGKSPSDAAVLRREMLSGICRFDVDKEQRADMKRLLSEVTLCYSFRGIRLDSVYDRSAAYNGSDPRTEETLKQGVRLQVLARWEWFASADRAEARYAAVLFAYKLALNINNSMTYNDSRTGKCVYDPVNTYKIGLVADDAVANAAGARKIVKLSGEEVTVDVERRQNATGERRMAKREMEALLDGCVAETGAEKPTTTAFMDYVNGKVLGSLRSGDGKYPARMRLPNRSALAYYAGLYGMEDRFSVSRRKRRGKEKPEP